MRSMIDMSMSACCNSYQFFVNNRLVGSGNNWAETDVWQFNAECNEPTVYAIHGLDAEVNTQGVGGMLAEITHCGETFHTNHR